MFRVVERKSRAAGGISMSRLAFLTARTNFRRSKVDGSRRKTFFLDVITRGARRVIRLTSL